MGINTLNSAFNLQNTWAGSLARIGHEPPKHTIHKTDVDFNDFSEYVFKKYSDNYAKMILRYVRRYGNLIEHPSMLETFSDSKKNNILKSLIAFSKFHGFYQQFKERIKNYGVTWSQSSSIDSFFRIMNSSSSDVLAWFSKSIEALDDDKLSTYLRFVLMSGMRKTEAIDSFNLLIRLDKERRVNDYYNEELESIEHFKYPAMFFRNTKNVFFTIMPRDVVLQIVQCDPITYEMLRKRLYRRGMSVRLRDLRDYYATFMVRHGLIKEEVDLLQGRISKSVFVRHYWSPAINELKNRVFKALEELKQTLFC